MLGVEGELRDRAGRAGPGALCAGALRRRGRVRGARPLLRRLHGRPQARPEVLGRLGRREVPGHRPHHLGRLGDGGGAPGATGQVDGEDRLVLRLEGVQRPADGEFVEGRVVGSAPPTSAVIGPARRRRRRAPGRSPPRPVPAASPSSAFSRRMPASIRVFTVPSGRAGQRRDLPLGVAAVVREGQRLTLRPGEPPEGHPHLFGHHARPGLLFHVPCRHRLVQRQILLGQRLPPPLRLLPADGVHRLVVHDRQQPGGEAAARPVVGRRVAPHAEEDLLQHVLGQGLVGEDAARQREGRAAESLVEVVDRRPVTRPDAPQQVSVQGGVLTDAAPEDSRLPWSHASFARRPPYGSPAPRSGIAESDARAGPVTGVTEVKESEMGRTQATQRSLT